MIKKIMAIMLCLLLVLPMALAQEESGETDAAGITPDSPLYFLDYTLDRLALSLKFGQAAKIENGLEIAQERLEEAKVMAEQGNFDKAEKARKRYDKIIDKTIDYVGEIKSNGDAEKAKDAMKSVSDIQNKIEGHYEKVAEVKDEILERQEGRMTEEQAAHMEEVFDKIKEKAKEVELKVDEKKEIAKIKYRILTEKSPEEVELLEEEIDEGTGLAEARRERAENTIQRAEATLAQARLQLRSGAAGDEGIASVSGKPLDRAKGRTIKNGVVKAPGIAEESSEALTANEQVFSDEEIAEIEGQIAQLEDLISRARKAKEAGRDKVARDIAEDLGNFGNEVSRIARTLRLAKIEGNFDEILAQKKELIREKQELHKEYVNEKAKEFEDGEMEASENEK